jgi:hypothetical protein
VAHAQLLGDVLVLHPFRSQQHNARTLRKPHTGQLGPLQLRQFGMFFAGQRDLGATRI